MWGPDQIPEALEHLSKADVIIGHNIVRYDLPVLKKLYGFAPRPEVILRDTMVCSRLIFPAIKASDTALIMKGQMPPGKAYAGKHTIAAWGYRLGVPKLHEDITDWSKWTQDIQDRCVGDTTTNMMLWDHLKVDAYSQAAIELEHRVQRMCDAIEQAGVPFDMVEAGKLHAKLLQASEEIEKKLIAQFGSWYQGISPDPAKCLFVPKVNNKKMGYEKGQPCSKLKIVTFNPGSRDHIAKVLLKKGWKPTKFTEGGAPEMNEEVVEGIVARYEEFAGLGEYLMLEKRLSQLVGGKQAWMQHVGPDGLIHGVINPMGCVTSRGSHFNPNLGQVPNLASPYGAECRGLFGRRTGWSFVGADMAGLELRCLAHDLFPFDGGKYAKIVIEGDPHWLHAQVMGLANGERDTHNKLHVVIREDGSKRFIYAYIYGCWDDKAGEIILGALTKARKECGAEGVELYIKFFGREAQPSERTIRKVGKTVRDAFLKRLEGFKPLKEKIETLVESYAAIPGLDGRRIPTRSEHSALNFRLQSSGAILCKRWGVDAFEDLCSRYKHGWDGDFVFCLWVHDEYQVAVRNGLEKEIGETLVKHARLAGIPYGFRVPLDSSYKVGRTWANTH